MALGGRYAQMYEVQARAYQTGGVPSWGLSRRVLPGTLRREDRRALRAQVLRLRQYLHVHAS